MGPRGIPDTKTVSHKVTSTSTSTSDDSQQSRKLAVNVRTEADGIGEDVANWEDKEHAVVNRGVYELAITLLLLVVTIR
jgi:hypothetical protein